MNRIIDIFCAPTTASGEKKTSLKLLHSNVQPELIGGLVLDSNSSDLDQLLSKPDLIECKYQVSEVIIVALEVKLILNDKNNYAKYSQRASSSEYPMLSLLPISEF